MAKSKTGNVLDLELLKRVLTFDTPYRMQFLIATIAAIFLSVLGPMLLMLIHYAVNNYIIIPN